ncbi:hypothetical protein PQC13_gp034 [Synechococcus phage S-SRM01]|uniref:Uncharacterized protein n=1 Tax=Synechococcus phage S-SRM01 TaxID=2781608 RepID=A0A879R299_9CAUD|nr:hypothetical protein PQC13_gp034 [Synechococcus phage S-SRM01]QPX47999.1 hypothetical protein [Synechococcus phage S-SRM01]
MALTGYEKPLDQYTQKELVEIAEKYAVYYTTATGQGRISGYQRLPKSQLISLIKNDHDYKSANPKSPKLSGTSRLGNRFSKFKESLFGNETPEQLMDEILTIASDTKRNFPVPGKYYTYIYYAATPRILYDRHPLIIAGDILPKGFRAFNYHWGKIRQYNTEDGDRLVSGLYELTPQEYNILKSVPYKRIIRN